MYTRIKLPITFILIILCKMDCVVYTIDIVSISYASILLKKTYLKPEQRNHFMQ